MMEDVKILLDQLPEAVRDTIGQGLKLRLSKVKTIHKSLSDAGYETTEQDEEMLLLSGDKEKVGLLTILGAVEDAKKDPDQVPLSIEGQPDFRTWKLTTDQTSELVAQICSDESPAQAVIMLNNLEDGEKQKEAGPRKSVLDVIRAARSPMAEKVNRLSVVNGDG